MRRQAVSFEQLGLNMQQQVEAAKAAKKGKRFDAPMSENVHKITNNWTADQPVPEDGDCPLILSQSTLSVSHR